MKNLVIPSLSPAEVYVLEFARTHSKIETLAFLNTPDIYAVNTKRCALSVLKAYKLLTPKNLKTRNTTSLYDTNDTPCRNTDKKKESDYMSWKMNELRKFL